MTSDIMQRFKAFYLFLKAFLVSFLLFAGISEVRLHGWTRLAIGNLAIAAWFTFTTFFILHLAQKKGIIK